MGEGLVELARRYVRLSDELETVRDEIKHAVLNGAAGGKSETPFAPARSKPGMSHSNAITARAAEERILALLKEGPKKMTEIMAAMEARQSTTSERLRRLRQRGLIALDGGAWVASP